MQAAKAKSIAPTAHQGNTTPVVFYDGGCSLCRREIRHYRRLDRTQRLRWVDISREPVRTRSYGLTVAQAMRRFHVLDGKGHWHTGVNGFVELWSHLPCYRWLASLIRALRLHRPLEFIYRHWAAWRLQRRCRDDQCGLFRE